MSIVSCHIPLIIGPEHGTRRAVKQALFLASRASLPDRDPRGQHQRMAKFEIGAKRTAVNGSYPLLVPSSTMLNLMPVTPLLTAVRALVS